MQVGASQPRKIVAQEPKYSAKTAPHAWSVDEEPLRTKYVNMEQMLASAPTRLNHNVGYVFRSPVSFRRADKHTTTSQTVSSGPRVASMSAKVIRVTPTPCSSGGFPSQLVSHSADKRQSYAQFAAAQRSVECINAARCVNSFGRLPGIPAPTRSEKRY
eukprot:3692509-Amphidinium_carterae.1